MEIILKQDIKNLGEKDDVLVVKDGYARNYLIPKGYAMLATPGAKKMLAENQRQAAHRQEKIKNQAIATAELLRNISLKVEALAGTEGKIFGSVTALQIANLLKEQGFEIDRKRITFNEDIKHIGQYIAYINLHKEVKVELPFDVTAKAK
ncbi:MAG: 50S ribosomal protein L9 [Bacteroidia bacterium]|nr:50S ribosomal protein L9 [Bacteroidia bacterium]